MSEQAENFRSARIVEIFNLDGKVTVYHSIWSATKSLGCRSTATLYKLIATGGGRIIDVRIPVEVMNGDGTKSISPDINDVARSFEISTMEVFTMVSNGQARLGSTVRKVLTKPVNGRKGAWVRCKVGMVNEDGMTMVFRGMREVARFLGCSTSSVYTKIALGKAWFVSKEEGKFYDTVKYQEKEEEEKFYDAVEYPEEDTVKPPKEFFKIISLMVKTMING